MFKVVLLLAYLIPSVSLGLVRDEKVVANVLQVESKQMVIDRGGSDAIRRGEFARILQDGRYKGRAIAIQVLPYVSQWALYYSYEPIGYASPVELKRSNPHPIIDEVRESMNLSLMDTARLNAFSPKKPARPKDDSDVDPEQEKFEQQLDLAERYASEETGEKNAALQAKQQLEEDLDDLLDEARPLFDGWNVSVGVSPFSLRRIGGEKALSLQSEIKTSRVRELTAHFQVESRDYRDQISGNNFEYSQYKGDLSIDIVRLNDQISLFSYATYERRQQGEAFPLRAHANIGPLGVKYDFTSVKAPWNFIDVSYIPTFDYQKSDYPIGNGDVETRSDVGLRHTFRLRAESEYMEKKLKMRNEFFVRPLQETDSLSLDFSGTHISHLIAFDYKLSEHFSMTYSNEFSREPRRRELQGVSASDMVHMFYINFSSSL